MKTIQSSLAFTIFVFLMISLFSGCYTQLALDSNRSDYESTTSSPSITQSPEPIFAISPIYIQPYNPISSPLPTAASSPGTSESHASFRDFGSQRSSTPTNSSPSRDGQASSTSPRSRSINR